MSIRNTLLGLTALTLVIGIWLATKPSRPVPNNSNVAASNSNVTPAETTPTPTVTAPTNLTPTPVANTNAATVEPAPTAALPIADFFERITKKPFGIYITPTTSPIQPEKFTGYHTGADAETTAAEQDTDLPIFSVTKGTVMFAGHVNGYGGVVIVRSAVDGTTYTMLYGHLRISSFTKKAGQSVSLGEQIAVLGTGFSSETDNERKHLHFGISKGSTINYRGYVSTKTALSAWEDPAAWLRTRLGE